MNTANSAPHHQLEKPLGATLPSTTGPVTLSDDQFDKLIRHLRYPPPELLDDEQAAAKLGVSVRKFHELRHEPWMPRAVVLGPRHKRWSATQLDAAIQNIPREEQVPAEPSQLAKGRAAKAGATEVR
jgi:predicted DNA-binding transcriptional regulator AlpA